MNTHSRSAAREGFALQRARLLFSAGPNRFPLAAALAKNIKSKGKRDLVRNGLIGFVPGRQ